MEFFANLLDSLDRYSEHNIVMRKVRTLEAGLCLVCGKKTGAPTGYIKSWCDSCRERRLA